MARRTRKGKHKALKILICLLVALALFVALFFFTARRFIVVSDAAWSQVMPTKEFIRIGRNLFLRWYRLSIIQTDISVLANQTDLEAFLNELSHKAVSGVVMFGPVASVKIVEYNIDASQLFSTATVYGIYGTRSTCFDATLSLNPISGWKEAGKTLTSETETMSQNIAIVSDLTGSIYNKAIVSQFPKGMVTEYTKADDSLLFISNTISNMDRLGITIALCPHLEDFYTIFSYNSSISWVVDYKYANIVPKKQLYGIVVLDLASFASNAKLDKDEVRLAGSNGCIMLNYKYDGQ